MKGSCTLVASVLAASTVAISSTSYAADPHVTEGHGYSSSAEKLRSDKSRKLKLPLTTSEKEKFAPRFDGLRFIQTLVTAHR